MYITYKLDANHCQGDSNKNVLLEIIGLKFWDIKRKTLLSENSHPMLSLGSGMLIVNHKCPKFWAFDKFKS